MQRRAPARNNEEAAAIDVARAAAAAAGHAHAAPRSNDSRAGVAVLSLVVRGVLCVVLPLSLLLCAYAAAATFSHRYPTPLQLLRSLTGVFEDGSYAAPQTCEMSYFHLAHRRVPVDSRLSDTSLRIREGRMPFLQAALSSPGTEAVEQSLPARAAAAEEFASFRQMFLHALPAEAEGCEGSSSRYTLWQFVEQAGPIGGGGAEKYPRAGGPPRVPVLFLHGSSGSFHQMRSLASRLNTVATEARLERGGAGEQGAPDLNDYYAIDAFEESAALSGRLLWQQAWFANEALRHVLASYSAGTRAVIVGHSMGGVAARAMFSLGNFPGGDRVAMVATLGAPQRAPPLMTDKLMQQFYALSNGRPLEAGTAAWEDPFSHLRPLVNSSSSLHSLYAAHTRAVEAAARGKGDSASIPRTPLLVSVAGGERDFQVEAFSTEVSEIYGEHVQVAARKKPPPLHTISLTLHALQYAPTALSGAPAASASAQSLSAQSVLGSGDHQCLAWCRQLIEVLAHAIRDLTLEELKPAGERRSFVENYERQLRLWVPPAVPALRAIAAASPVAADTEAPPPAAREWLLHADDFATAEGAVVATLNLDTPPAQVVCVWSGDMERVELCQSAEGPCRDLTSAVVTLAPQWHPAHALLTPQQRASKKLGAGSSFLLHISSAQLGSAGASSLRFTMSAPSAQLLRSLPALSSGARRLLGWALGFSSLQAVASSGGEAELAPAPGAYLWTHPLPYGLDSHWELRVDSTAPEPASHDLAPPELVALFSATAGDGEEGGAAASPLRFDRSTFSDHLFAFHPSATAESRRTLHFYRSGRTRKAVGLLLRAPTQASSSQGGAAAVRVRLSEHGWASLLHSLFLQWPLLPQLLLGAALCLYAAQHDHLRTHHRFPRPHELLLGTARAAMGHARAGSSISPTLAWVFGALLVAFCASWHGSLHGSAIVRQVSGEGEGSFLPSLRLSDSCMQVHLLGVAALAACGAMLLLLECVLFNLLRALRLVCSGVWWALSWPVRRCTKQAPELGGPAAAGSVPERRALSRLLHRATLACYGSLFAGALLFSFSLGLFSVAHLAGFRALHSAASFLAVQAVAWLSTILMHARLIEAHFFWGRDIAEPLLRVVTVASDVPLLALVGGVALLALLVHAATFPSLPASSKRGPGLALTWNETKALNSRAYKSSSMLLLLLLAALLCLPSLLASFRLDVARLEAARATHQQQAGPLALWASGAGTPKVFDSRLAHPAPTYKPSGGPKAQSLAEAEASLRGEATAAYVWPFSLAALGEGHAGVLLALCWAVLQAWGSLHTPFAPPLLECVCIGAFGVRMLLDSASPPTTLATLASPPVMLCLCMLPHALASVLYCLHLLLDYAEGSVGAYDRRFEQEIAQHQPQQQGQKRD